MAKSVLIHLLALSSTITAFVIVPRQLLPSDTTSKDVENGVCAPTTLIFARGTTEEGNMGKVVGPPLATAMKAAFGQVAVQGVNYAADVTGASSGALNPKNAAGSLNMAKLAQMARTKCPKTKIVLSGYSQGAEQVRGALMNMPNGMAAAAVTFGDPLMTQAFKNIAQEKTKINCNTFDAVCKSMFIISMAHLSYGKDGAIGKSITFLKGALV